MTTFSISTSSVILIFPTILFPFLWTSFRCLVVLSSSETEVICFISLWIQMLTGQFIGNEGRHSTKVYEMSGHAYVHSHRHPASLTMYSSYATFAHRVALTYAEILSPREGKAQLKLLGLGRQLSV